MGLAECVELWIPREIIIIVVGIVFAIVIAVVIAIVIVIVNATVVVLGIAILHKIGIVLVFFSLSGSLLLLSLVLWLSLS